MRRCMWTDKNRLFIRKCVSSCVFRYPESEHSMSQNRFANLAKLLKRTSLDARFLKLDSSFALAAWSAACFPRTCVIVSQFPQLGMIITAPFRTITNAIESFAAETIPSTTASWQLQRHGKLNLTPCPFRSGRSKCGLTPSEEAQEPRARSRHGALSRALSWPSSGITSSCTACFPSRARPRNNLLSEASVHPTIFPQA